MKIESSVLLTIERWRLRFASHLHLAKVRCKSAQTALQKSQVQILLGYEPNCNQIALLVCKGKIFIWSANQVIIQNALQLHF